ncbi:MAG TPA: methyltransferase domain-containing protein [Patescibacteria group bacterium]|nr:methyltransferase domain-containing protein [Patescibacteria group bacterium]
MTTPVIFDRRQVRRNRERAAARMAEHGFLFDWAMQNLIDRLAVVRRKFPQILQIGARSKPDLTNALAEAVDAENVTVMDAPALLSRYRGSRRVAADEEALPFAQHTFDLVVSPLSLHTVNDLPGALIQIRRCLKPDGLFLGALPGGRTLFELRECLMEAELAIKGGISPRVIPLADKQQAGALMQRAHYTMPVVDSDIVTVTYKDVTSMMMDLRGMGENNTVTARSRAFAGKQLWQEVENVYKKKFAEADGRLPATFEIIFLSGWSPHESQQKPLRPGSAQHSLAEALGTTEISSGEKARP